VYTLAPNPKAFLGTPTENVLQYSNKAANYTPLLSYVVGSTSQWSGIDDEDLNEWLAYAKKPNGPHWFVDAKKLSTGVDLQLSRSDDGLVLRGSVRMPSLINVFASDAMHWTNEAVAATPWLTFGTESRDAWSARTAAILDLLYLETVPFDQDAYETRDVYEAGTGAPSTLDGVRADLQAWFAVSVDDLALMLDLSPTTIVNLGKPGRTVRARTARKIRSVHGLVKELQRVMGAQSALAWARTVGRRLLVDGDLMSFEQFVSTHIFPTASDLYRGTARFGSDDAELVTKERAPVGRASRL